MILSWSEVLLEMEKWLEHHQNQPCIGKATAYVVYENEEIKANLCLCVSIYVVYVLYGVALKASKTKGR